MPRNTRMYADFNLAEMGKKCINEASYTALGQMADEMLADINTLVPKNTGLLRRNGQVEDITHSDGGNITFTWHRGLNVGGEYIPDVAEKVYYGINPVTGKPIKHWTTEGTGGNWMENSRDEFLDEWKSKYTKRLLREYSKSLKK